MTSIASADVSRLADALKQTAQKSETTTFQVLVNSSQYILSEMERRVPVKSGGLRDSLGVKVVGRSVIIGPSAAHARFVEFDTKPHDITPKKPGGVLAFQMGGRTVFYKKVHHPGTTAQPFIRPAFEAWVDSLGELAAEANIKVLKEAAGA